MKTIFFGSLLVAASVVAEPVLADVGTAFEPLYLSGKPGQELKASVYSDFERDLEFRYVLKSVDTNDLIYASPLISMPAGTKDGYTVKIKVPSDAAKGLRKYNLGIFVAKKGDMGNQAKEAFSVIPVSVE